MPLDNSAQILKKHSIFENLSEDILKQIEKLLNEKTGFVNVQMSASAMGLEKEVGSITIGKRDNLILTKTINSYSYLFYAFGTNHIDSVYINGEKQDE